MLAKVVSLQWHSTRRVAGTTYQDPYVDRGLGHVASTDVAHYREIGIANSTERLKLPAVPLLDISRLSTREVEASAGVITDPVDVDIQSQQHRQPLQQHGDGDEEDHVRVGKRPRFELAFLRKARLATTLKKK